MYQAQDRLSMATNASSAPGGPTPSCSTQLIGAPSGRDGAPWDSALQALDLDAWYDIDRSCDPRGCNDAFAGPAVGVRIPCGTSMR
jgi:hypothetical protein